MANTYSDITLHITFHVKDNTTLIARDDLPRLHQYIGGIIRSMGGIPILIGGEPDHVHILTSLPTTVALSDFMMHIKKNSSKWIKGIAERYRHFAWQSGYAAFSVSRSVVPACVKYIANQQEHHRHKTMAEELKAFLEKCGIPYDEKYL